MNTLIVELDKNSEHRFHIESFVVANAERGVFEKTMKRALALVATQAGCRDQLVFENIGNSTMLDVVAIVAWESEQAFDDASAAISALYRELGVDASTRPNRFTAFACTRVSISSAQSVSVLTDAVHELTIAFENDPNLHFRIGTFFVPKVAQAELEEAMKQSHAFDENQAGCRGHLVFERAAGPATIQVVSVAIWESQRALEDASEALRVHEQEIGFDVPALLSRWGARGEIGNYRRLRSTT